jgi:glycosyltransferase involved in cell wall biosynthesis
VNRGRSLLALTGDLSRTGAPRLLASLLAELRDDGATDPDRTRVLAQRGGPLAGAMGDVAAVRVLGPAADLTGRAARRLATTAQPAGDRLGMALSLLRQPASGGGPPDLVWANGATALRMAAALPGPARRAPLVAHVHEMEIGLRRSLAGLDAAALLDRAAVVVAVSGAVRDHLVAGVGVDPDRVIVHHGWVPGLGAEGPPPVTATRPAAVPDHALVVGACGALGWRKGADLFLELARRLPASVGGRPVHLVWVGGPDRPDDDRRAATDVGLRGLEGRVHLAGEVPDAGPWLAGMDVLALTSREDPFPLVVLEAGARGVPVVGFRSGGIAEAVPDDDHGACLAPPLDVDHLAGLVEALLAEPAARRSVGGSLASRVRAGHTAAPRVRALWAEVAARLARR